MSPSQPGSIPVGPGYQTFVSRLIQRIALEHEIVWATAGDAQDASDHRRGRRACQGRAVVPDLARVPDSSRRARPAAGASAGSISGRRPTSASRSKAPSPRASDRATTPGLTPPWPIPGTPPRSRRGGRTRRTATVSSTALSVSCGPTSGGACPPTMPERLIQEEVLRLLSRAFPLDPSLPYPWREWKELHEHPRHR